MLNDSTLVPLLTVEDQEAEVVELVAWAIAWVEAAVLVVLVLISP